jgi:outer membrane cobalamin receptor
MNPTTAFLIPGSCRIRNLSILGALALAATITVFAAPAAAQEPEDDVDKIVVTGTRATNLLNEVPFAATVINLEEIEARNKQSVADLLRNLPGVHVIQPSGQGGTARIYLRGADLEMTMVLLDGVRVNDPNDSRGSAFDFSTINMNDVERIEIVRGPQSAVYGSDALAGVINIISKDRAEELGGSIAAEVGTDDYYRAALDITGPVGESGGFSLRAATKDDGEPVPGTTFSSDSISGRLSLAGGDNWHARFFGNYTDSEGSAFPEDSGGYDLAVIRDTDIRSAEDFRLGVDGSVRLSEKWRLNVLATWYDHDASYFSPGVAPGVRDPVPPNGADSQLERANIAVNAVVAVNDNLTATFGADYYDEDGVSDGFVEFFPGFIIPAGFDFKRSVTGVFGELHYKSDTGPTLLGSVRRDDPDQESGETTSKLGILHSFNQGRTSIRANWGQGFSLPGFFALASPLVGNPNLRPETSESLDIGLTQRSADGRVSATVGLFHNEFTDLIDFDSTVFSMVNRDRLEVDGVEMLLDYAFNEQLSVQAQATYLDMELVNSDVPLRQRPEWRGGLAVRWLAAEQWLVDASWLNVGKTFDSSIPTGDMYLDGYNRIDATVTYSPTDKMNLLLSVDNLLDEGYYEAIGFPSPGTRARLGIRYRF